MFPACSWIPGSGPAAARGRAARLALLACLSLLLVDRASAAYLLVPDAPTSLGGTTWEPHDIVRDDAGSFSLELSLPEGISVDALHRLSTGQWLFSVSEPADLDGVTFDPRDIIRYDGSSFSLFFDGAAAGIPAWANVDALFLHGGDGGDLVVSFDVPVTIGGDSYEPADLAMWDGASFHLYFDSSAVVPPIPPSVNLVEADEKGGALYLTFDVPAILAGETFLPGQIVSWDGSAFALRFDGDGWPEGGVLSGLALEACLDSDGDGFGYPGDPACPGGPAPDCNDADPGAVAPPDDVSNLQVSDIPGGYLFTWSGEAGSAGSGTVYDVFTGSASALHPSGSFATGTCRAEDLTAASLDEVGSTPPPGTAWYYLIRAQNSCATGTYGTANRDATSAASPGACR